MNKIMLMAIGLSLAGASIAQAQPYDPGRGPPPAVRPVGPGDRDHGDRGDEWRRHHRGHRVCFWRHHERICHWRR